jgi:sugar lactone lactonase YvrE
MSLDRRLKHAFSMATERIGDPSVEPELEVLLEQGRRSRRNRRLGGLLAVLAVVVVAVFILPRALDALRSLGTERNRPATPQDARDEHGVIETVVGTGVPHSTGDGGPAAAAAIRYPFDLVVDGAGNLYVLENRRIRKVDASGRISTVAGPLAKPATAEPPVPTEANGLRLWGANALAIDAHANLYVGGGDNNRFVVTKISPTGQVTRVAGTGRSGFSGDGGPAIEARLGLVYDLAVDDAGNIYIVDQDNNRIRMVDQDGTISTIAGTGEPGYTGDGGPATEAQLDHPWGIALDGNGNVYITVGPSVVRRIDSGGVITTIAGSGRVGYAGDGGPALQARLNSPEHVAVDGEGNVYIEDTGNNCIRMVDSNGVITTIVGMGGGGFRGDGGPARLARLSQPSGMLLTPDGVLYIADSANNRIRSVTL